MHKYVFKNAFTLLEILNLSYSYWFVNSAKKPILWTAYAEEYASEKRQYMLGKETLQAS